MCILSDPQALILLQVLGFVFLPVYIASKVRRGGSTIDIKLRYSVQLPSSSSVSDADVQGDTSGLKLGLVDFFLLFHCQLKIGAVSGTTETKSTNPSL